MKTKYLFITFLIVLFSNCKKPKEAEVEACISGPESIDRGEQASFSWCGENADEVNWTSSDGGIGSGNNFSHLFTSPGKYTITATGRKKNSVSTTKEVSYGLTNHITAVISDGCNPGVGTGAGYKAYLYTSKENWLADLENNMSHQKAIDSTTCKYSSTEQTIIAEFTCTFTPRQKLIIFVTGPNKASSAGDLVMIFNDPIYDSTTSNGQIWLTLGREKTNVHLDNTSYRFFGKRWKLQSNYLNLVYVPLPDCNKDDYLDFKADGTWTYETGADNCGGSSVSSNGTYSTFNATGCIFSNSGFNLTTKSGPFVPTLCKLESSILTVYYKVGSDQGYFEFALQN